MIGFTLPVLAQDASLRGSITDAASGQGIQGVNIVLQNDAGTQAGTVTNGDGLFILNRISPGQYTLRISFIGFETVSDTLVLQAGEDQSIQVALTEANEALDEVLVEGEREAQGAKIVAGLQTVSARDLELIPAPDITADLVSYLTTMPGIVTTGDRGGQLFIRGGEPAHNLVLLDGMPIYQPFHVLGFYSAFSADILQRADIHAGGYGSRYSGRASAIVDVHARNGNKLAHEKAVSIAPFVNTVRVEGPLIEDRISFLGSVRQSVIDRIASKYVGQELPYRFGDVFLKGHWQVNENQQLSVTGLHTYDRGGLANEAAAGKDEVRWTNQAVGFRYLMLPRTSPLLAEVQASVARLESETGPRGIASRTSDINSFNSSIHITTYAGRSEVGFGAYFRVTELSTQLGGLYQNLNSDDSRLSKFGFYAEPDIYLGQGLRIRPGASLQFFVDRFLVEPRIRAVLERGANTLSLAAGLYHQEYVGLNDRRDATNIFTAWATVPVDDVPQAIQLVGGYQRDIGEGVTLSLEAYYKRLRNLYIAEWTPFPRLTTNLQEASGEVRGFDLRLEIQRPSFYGFLTYGLSSVTYEAQQASLERWFGEATITFRPPHDRRHQVNAVLTFELGKYNANVRWNFGSGLPYNQVRGFDRFILLNGEVDFTEEPGDIRVIYDEPFGGVLPTYHRLDVSVDRVFPFTGGAFTMQAGVINVYDRANLFALDLFTLEQTFQLPIVPTVGMKIDF